MRALPIRTVLLVAFAALVAAAFAVVAVQPAQSAAAPVRIMPLGDSITGSPGCWRALLWSRLQAAGHTNIDFVGTLPPQGCAVAHDGDNEGHGGALVTNVADQNQLPGWLSATRPDIVLMHFGTNDVWSSRSPSVILAAYSRLVDQMRASNPSMRVLVAQIIPMAASACAECPARVTALNAAIPAWAAGKSTPQSPVVVVDQFTGFNTASDTYDGVHPNDAGNVKLANGWLPALAAQLSGVPPTASPSPTPSTPSPRPSSPSATPTSPSPTPTSSTPTSPSPTSTPGGRVCTATYRIAGQWPGGFQGEVVVANTGPTAISRWSVRFRLASGQAITQSWSSTLSQTGPDVIASNAPWNGSLNPATSTTFGFIGSWSGTNPIPATTCTAG